LEFLTVFKYYLSFRIFEQVALALKTELALKFFKPAGDGLAASPNTPSPTPVDIEIQHAQTIAHVIQSAKQLAECWMQCEGTTNLYTLLCTTGRFKL